VIVIRTSAGLLLLAAAAVLATSCSNHAASPLEEELTYPISAEAPLPLPELARQADLIVVGTVVESNEAGVVIGIERVLAGDHPNRASLQVSSTGQSPVGTYGVWFLSTDGEPRLLGNAVDSYSAVRAVERVLAGLSPEDSPPSGDALRVLADQSDAVVSVEYRHSTGGSASARVLEVLKGNPPSEMQVERAALPISPGGPWELPPSDAEWSGYGVLFLKRQGEKWVVLNPTDPGLYRRQAVLDALVARR
jgi:hypothetical protein